MAIEKNNFKVSRFDPEFSPQSRESMSSDDELHRRSSVVDSDDDDDDEFNDADSGAGSDDFDLLELGETRAEFCQVGNQTCSVPFELYDLPDLSEVLSLDVWNECLSEEERFSLTKYLPDMDQGTFMRTLNELFTGANFHFGSPISKIFDMLKGGLCEPRVALYRQGLNFCQKRQHYHLLRQHQNNMVSNLYNIREAWIKYKGYSIEEKLQVLNIMRSERSLMYEKMEDMGLESDSSEREESGEGLWSQKLTDRKAGQKLGRHPVHGVTPTLDLSSRGRSVALDSASHVKQNPKGTLKLAGSKTPSAKELVGRFSSVHHGLDSKPGSYGSTIGLPRQNKAAGPDFGAALRMRDQMRGDDAEGFSSVHHGLDSKPGSYGSTIGLPRQNKAAGPDFGAALRMRDQMRGNNAEERMYHMDIQRDLNVSRGGSMDKAGVLKMGKKHDYLKVDEYTTDSFTGLPQSLKDDLYAYGGNNNVNQLSDIKVLTAKPSNARTSYDFGKKAKYPENVQQRAFVEQMKFAKGRVPHLPLKGHHVDLSDRSEPVWHKKTQGEAFSMDPSFKYDDWNVTRKKWKSGRESPDLKLKSYRTSPPLINDRLLHSEYGAKSSQEKIRGKSVQNGQPDMQVRKGTRIFTKSEETESDSSEQLDDEEDSNPLMRSKSAYPSGVLGSSRSSFLKSGRDPKNSKFAKKDKKENAAGTTGAFGGITSSKNMGDVGEESHFPEIDNYSSKAKQKGKMRDTGHLRSSASVAVEDNYYSGAGALDDDGYRKPTYKLGKNGKLQREPGERLQMSSLKSHPADRRHKGEVGLDHSVRHPSYLHDYAVDEGDDLLETPVLGDDNGRGRLAKKDQNNQSYLNGRHESSDAPLIGCNLATKKRKGKEDVKTYVDGQDDYDYLQSDLQQKSEDSLFLKKQERMKLDVDSGSIDMGNSEPHAIEAEVTDVELDTKPQTKPFTLITPTSHTGFSFSIIHLLSAVRIALITPNLEDSLEISKQLEKNTGMQNIREEQNIKHEGDNGVDSLENVDMNNFGHLPSFTVQEIVNRVRSNPGDPCILETQEPLQDLIRGVLKIFSSKTAPLGAKGWKPLVFYERSTKSWCWIGPASLTSSDYETIEEVTSAEAWDLPHKMLVKLVDSFANWLKSGQETLQQIGSLPAPPSSLMQSNPEEKDRFKDLRAQKSLNTITPCSEEVRAYFRREEVLRYSIPDRAFSYTAADGRKSIVAPLRRCGGKPTSKARDHFMLKRDRPPHVTILCLVRDAAARLPGSIGTRADVCTLIRDSQYIVEDVSDAQVNQVVSGALDRLHYERDPCVQFDSERKLWVYLHREREEEDFEDDGTSSTKKWKRQKKDAAEPFDQVTVAYPGNEEQTGFDLCSDLNAEPSCMDEDKRMELVYDDVRPKVEDNIDTNHGAEQATMRRGHPMVWQAFELNPMRENKLLCQENSTNEDFDDDSFGRERPVGLLSASLL